MSVNLPPDVVMTLDKVIFGSSSSSSIENSSSTEDRLRWYQQGFRFAHGEGLLPCGLLQSTGGPCGILATIQAFLLCELVFGVSAFDASRRDVKTSAVIGEAGCGSNLNKLASTTHEAADNALAGSLAFAIWQAATAERGSGVAQLVTLSSSELLRPGASGVPLSCTAYRSYADLRNGCRNMLNVFRSDSGVMLLVYCLLLSRGVETISRTDMDEPGPLVARFGHCTQELLNLAMTGEAVAGVFDGDRGFSTSDEPMTSSSSPLSDSSAFKLRGISRRPIIGFLSHIEAMKYSVVGDFLKTPTMPFWLIGSESHLTLLWAADAAANDESPSAPLMRVFKKFEPTEGCGYIQSDNLMPALNDIGITQLEAVQLGPAEKLDPTQSGIVLWTDFWKVLAPLWEMRLKAQLSSELVSNNASENIIMATGGTGGPSPSLTSSSSSSSSSKPGASNIADMREIAQSLFMSMDVDGGGFIRSEAVHELVCSTLSNVIGLSFDAHSGSSMVTDTPSSSSSSSSSSNQGTVTAEEVSRTVSKLSDRESIVFLEQFLAEIEPFFQRHLQNVQRNAHQNDAEILMQVSKPTDGVGSISGNNHGSGGEGGGGGVVTKRPRSDSDVARELQAYERSQPVNYPDYAPRPTTPEYCSDSEQRTRSSSLSGLSGAMMSNVNSYHGNNKILRTSDSSDAFMSSSSAFIQPNLSRNVEMFHWNGMFSHSRRPQLTRIVLQQRDTGSTQGLDSDLMFGSESSLGTTEEQTKRAIELSLAPQLSAVASMTSDGRLAPGTALAAKAANAIEAILRTKWAKATLVFPDGGVPPSLD